MCTCEVNTHTWTSEDSSQGSVLAFYRVTTGDRTQVLRLDSRVLSLTEPSLAEHYRWENHTEAKI